MFDLGRIEPQKMEKVLEKWDWDLFYKEGVYMDVESRKNAISFRNNLMRLAKLYIDKEEFENAERILDMSLNKMPLEVFKHYGICLSYPEYYYQIGKVEKARKVLVFLMGKFNEELLYYSQFEKRQFDFVFDEVEKNLNMYRSLLSDVEKYDSDKEFLSLIQNRFISLIKRYEHLIEFGT